MSSLTLFEHFSILIDLPEDEHANYIAINLQDANQIAELKALVATHFESNEKTKWHDLIANQAQEITGDDQLHSLTGTNIGVYSLTKVIGEGGMGVVFLAERNDGMMQQQVAIKFLFPSIVHVVGSLLVHNQAQILARLNHPNITHVYDAGTTDSGLHYVVMEYIEGSPIDEYCQTQQLNFIERIKLFLDVCDAITKTHLINIAHSDIKPANVLVNKDGVVKILDFDIAKTLQSSEQELATSFENSSENEGVKRYLRALSLAYASPEQLTGQPLTLETDQYSLAVLLYVLLSEETPFDVNNKPINELVDAIKVGNAKPLEINSNKVKSSHYQQWTMVNDIALIINKAMSADVTKRYGSVAAFKSDIHKTLKHFPTDVNNSPVQRVKKWLVRKPLLAAIYGLAITAGVVITQQNEQILQERNVALQEKVKAEKQTKRAEQERLNANEVANQLADVFKQADPTKSQAKELTAKDMLAQGYESIVASTTLSANSKLRLLTVIAESYYGQGQYEEAVKVLEAILENSDNLTKDIENNIFLSKLLIESYGLQKRDSEAFLFIEQLNNAIQLSTLNHEDKYKLTLLAHLASSGALISQKGLGGIMKQGNIVDEIEQALLNKRLALTKQELIELKYQTLRGLHVKNITYQELDETYTQASYVQLQLRIIKLSKELLSLISGSHKYFYRTVQIYSNMHQYSYTEEGEPASTILINALPEIMMFYGSEHPYIAKVYYAVVKASSYENNLAQAKLYATKRLTLLKKIHGSSHFDYGKAAESLSYVYQVMGDFNEADPLLHLSYNVLKKDFYQSRINKKDVIEEYAEMITFMIYHYLNSERPDKVFVYLDELHTLLSLDGAEDAIDLFTVYRKYQQVLSLLLAHKYSDVIAELEPKVESLLDSAELLITAYVETKKYSEAITLAERHKKVVLSRFASFHPEYYYQQFGFDLGKAYGLSGDQVNAQRTLQEMFDYNVKLNPSPENYWLQRILRDAKTYGVAITR